MSVDNLSYFAGQGDGADDARLFFVIEINDHPVVVSTTRSMMEFDLQGLEFAGYCGPTSVVPIFKRAPVD